MVGSAIVNQTLGRSGLGNIQVQGLRTGGRSYVLKVGVAGKVGGAENSLWASWVWQECLDFSLSVRELDSKCVEPRVVWDASPGGGYDWRGPGWDASPGDGYDC